MQNLQRKCNKVIEVGWSDQFPALQESLDFFLVCRAHMTDRHAYLYLILSNQTRITPCILF